MALIKFLKNFEISINKDKYWSCIFTFIQISLIGFIDYSSGYKLGLSIFYLLPIYIITWCQTKKHGIVFAIYGVLTWVISDLISRDFNVSIFIEIWNGLIRLGFFLIFVFMLQELKTALQREKKLSRTDYLTGLSNNQHFFELLTLEIHKSQRFKRAFTVAYLDCDNFKQINDTLGHPEGDRLLQVLAETLRKETRITDSIARLGGDEFVILLSETGAKTSFHTVNRLKEKLLNQMKTQKWPVTFSIGMVTFESAPETAEKAIKKADELMYKAKHKGKNRIIQKTINS